MDGCTIIKGRDLKLGGKYPGKSMVTIQVLILATKLANHHNLSYIDIQSINAELSILGWGGLKSSEAIRVESFKIPGAKSPPLPLNRSCLR